MTRKGGLIGLAALLLGGVGHGAGRRPYGGTIAVPVTGFGGYADPHRALTPSDRLGALLAHCRLLAMGPSGRITGELALGPGGYAGRTLTLTLREGAAFHDGSPVTATDAAASLDRLRQLGRKGGLGTALEGLRFEAADGRTLKIGGPPEMVGGQLRRILARVEASVLRGGQPGPLRGCGAFRPGQASAERVDLHAFDRHALGRPWLERVTLVRVPGVEGEVQGFLYGALGVGLEPSPRYGAGEALATRGRTTVLLVPHPRLAGDSGLASRRALLRRVADARLERFVGWQAEAALSPWPEPLAPLEAGLPPDPGTVRLAALAIAYPAGDDELERLARALRDTLRGLAGEPARALPVEGLDLRGAVEARDPTWDLALVPHHWASLTPEQAALELADLLGLPGPGVAAFLRGQTEPWARALVRDARVLPVLHVARPLHVKAPYEIVPSSGGLPDLAESWARP